MRKIAAAAMRCLAGKRKGMRLLTIAFAAPLLLVGGCIRSEHVKLTATVEADGVEYKGSVVNGFSCHRGGLFLGDNNGCNVEGDAAVIPMGPHGYAFLTLAYVRNAVDVMPDSMAYDGHDAASTKAWDVPMEMHHT